MLGNLEYIPCKRNVIQVHVAKKNIKRVKIHLKVTILISEFFTLNRSNDAHTSGSHLVSVSQYKDSLKFP